MPVSYNKLWKILIDKNLKRKKKLETLRKSQLYYEEKYNDASKFEMLIMKYFYKIAINFIR